MNLQKFDPHGLHRVDLLDVNGIYKFKNLFVPNGITNVGKAANLDTFFNGLTQIPQANWSISLIDGSGSPNVQATDTLASHPGWAEFTAYSGNRPAWGQGNSASQAVQNASPVTFNITTAGTLYGIIVCSVSSGNSGLLWSTAAFPAAVSVAVGDQMKVTYILAT